MKKTYMIPTVEVIELATNQQLMAGSPALGGEYGGKTPEAREIYDELDFMFDD